MKDKKRYAWGIGIPLGIIITTFVVANIGNIGNIAIVDDNIIINDVENEIEEEMVWHTEFEWYPMAENEPGVDTGGFMSCFLLDYGADPATVLANNATDWNTTGGTTHGYADYDDWSGDAVSEDPFYVVVRACFNQSQAMGGGTWNASRCRVTITASGDETISQTVVGNNTAETYGGGIESDNNSAYTKLYINFYFDDNSDGYRILDDGSLIISLIKIEAKY